LNKISTEVGKNPKKMEFVAASSFSNLALSKDAIYISSDDEKSLVSHQKSSRSNGNQTKTHTPREGSKIKKKKKKSDSKWPESFLSEENETVLDYIAPNDISTSRPSSASPRPSPGIASSPIAVDSSSSESSHESVLESESEIPFDLTHNISPKNSQSSNQFFNEKEPGENERESRIRTRSKGLDVDPFKRKRNKDDEADSEEEVRSYKRSERKQKLNPANYYVNLKVKIPENFPLSIEYLLANEWSHALASTIRVEKHKFDGWMTRPDTPKKKFAIEIITSDQPSYVKGSNETKFVAMEPIKSDEFIGEYVGEIVHELKKIKNHLEWISIN